MFQTWLAAVTAAMGLSVGVMQLAADTILDLHVNHKRLATPAPF